MSEVHTTVRPENLTGRDHSSEDDIQMDLPEMGHTVVERILLAKKEV
jgi:hypothetical protein